MDIRVIGGVDDRSQVVVQGLKALHRVKQVDDGTGTKFARVLDGNLDDKLQLILHGGGKQRLHETQDGCRGERLKVPDEPVGVNVLCLERTRWMSLSSVYSSRARWCSLAVSQRRAIELTVKVGKDAIR